MLLLLLLLAVVVVDAAPALNPPAPEPGLRRRANLGSSLFMHQRTTPLGSAAGMQQQQYRPREDAQTRYNNAAQVESTIVEVRCSFCEQIYSAEQLIALDMSVDHRHVYSDGDHGR